MVGSAPPFHRLHQFPSIAPYRSRSLGAAQAFAFSSPGVPASLAPVAKSSTSWSLGLGTSMTSNGFRVRLSWSTELLRFPASCDFISDLQLVPLVFALSSGSDLRSRSAVRCPFLAPVSCKARGLIGTIDLLQCVPGQRSPKRSSVPLEDWSTCFGASGLVCSAVLTSTFEAQQPLSPTGPEHRRCECVKTAAR